MEFARHLQYALAKEIGQERFDLWFADVKFQLEEPVIKVIAETAFQVDRLRRDFLGSISAAALSIGLAEPSVEFIVDTNGAKHDRGAQTHTSDAQKPATSARRERPSVRLREASSTGRGRRFRTFSSFVQGECNQLARASVDMVTRQPGEVSPLVIHGPTGVGKTHLMEAIWCQAKTRQPRCRVLYLSAEQFTTYFLEGLKGNGLPAFRRKYRQADLLIIDDIQFFAGKQATLVELTYTIDELSRENRQLILTADRPPASLASSLGKEVANRLCGGLVCGMKPVEQSTMESISKCWAAERKIDMDDGVHAVIASRMQGDARQLSGILNRLRATSLALGEPITMRMANEVIHELIPTQSRLIRLQDIRKTICEVFGIESDALQQTVRSRAITQPRMVAMWLARKHTSAGLHEISRYFGRRSHSSAITAHSTVDGWISEGTKLKINGQECDIRDIVGQIEAGLRAG